MEHGAGLLLRDGFILLGFALGFVLLFRRFGLGATLGYLVAGAVVGPHVLGLVGDAEAMSGIGELGIVLLLFIVGLELNPINPQRMQTLLFQVRRPERSMRPNRLFEKASLLPPRG